MQRSLLRFASAFVLVWVGCEDAPTPTFETAGPAVGSSAPRPSTDPVPGETAASSTSATTSATTSETLGPSEPPALESPEETALRAAIDEARLGSAAFDPRTIPEGLRRLALARDGGEDADVGFTAFEEVALDDGLRFAVFGLGERALAEEYFCAPGTLPTTDFLFALVADGPTGPRLVNSHLVHTDDITSAAPCTPGVGLGAMDVDGDGSLDAVVEASVAGADGYLLLSVSRLYVVSRRPSFEVVFDHPLTHSTTVNEPGCYEGDDPEGEFGVETNEVARFSFASPTPNAPMELVIERESFLRGCGREMHPVHRRGPSGSCIQEVGFGWSAARRTFLPFRGVAAESYILVTQQGRDEAAIASDVEALQGQLTGFGPGFPRVARTDDVSGLRPGLFVLLAGRCASRAEAESLRRALPTGLARHAFVRGIGDAAVDGDCPTALRVVDMGGSPEP